MCSGLQGSFSENQSGPTAPSPVHLSSVQEIQQFGQLCNICFLHTYIGTEKFAHYSRFEQFIAGSEFIVIAPQCVRGVLLKWAAKKKAEAATFFQKLMEISTCWVIEKCLHRLSI